MYCLGIGTHDCEIGYAVCIYPYLACNLFLLQLCGVHAFSSNDVLSTPQWCPSLLLLLRHERVDVDALAQLETGIPQQCVHDVEMKV